MLKKKERETEFQNVNKNKGWTMVVKNNNNEVVVEQGGYSGN